MLFDTLFLSLLSPKAADNKLFNIFPLRSLFFLFILPVFLKCLLALDRLY